MGYINLPDVDQITQEKDPKKQMEMMLNTMGLLMKSLTELNGYITTMNVKELNAKVLIAESITTDKLRAGSVVADKIDVDELSAISANLGHIIAGLIESVQIFGSYIATSQNYPRAEMSIINNFFAAISSPGNYLAVTPNGSGGVPTISIVAANSIVGFLNRSFGTTTLGTFGGENLGFQSSGSINLNPAGQLLIDGTSGFTGTVYVSPTRNGELTMPLIFKKGICVS